MSVELEIKRPVRPPVPPAPKPGGARRVVQTLLFYVLLPLVILAGGVVGAKHLIDTAPAVERRPSEPQAVPVEAVAFYRDDASANVKVMGTVVPAQRIILQPRVGGEVVKLSPNLVPGGRFQAGEFMLQIDPQDYELALERTRETLALAEYAYKIEQGHQEIAEREWELLDMRAEASDLDRELALRKPHLLRTAAAMDAAKAAVRAAELDLERTTIRAPFNCQVISEDVDLGAQVSPQTALAQLVGSDEYWVQAAVPVDQLRWIEFPDEHGQGGSEAVVRQELGSGLLGEWRGRVVRLMGDLDARARMARVLVSVPDPLGIMDPEPDRLPLLLDAFVGSVTIQGKPIDDVISMPRTALREGNRVWVMNSENALDIRNVEIVWSNQQTVLIDSGLESGDRVVVSHIPAPVQGMALRLFDDQPSSTSQAAIAE